MSSNYDYVIEVKVLDEVAVPGKPLGRHVRHDSRSKMYAAPEVDSSTFVKVDWADSVLLDQGQLGSCTGNATVGNLGTAPFLSTLPSGTTLDEPLAVKIYSLATNLDSYSGSYPPTDTGSDGLSAAKAAKQLGYISGYTHALSLNAALAALQNGPVITGVSWYEGFDNPDSNGLVSISGQVRGGHEFVIVGHDPATQLVKARNSWGSSFGVDGYFYFSESDWARLLSEQGDVTIFTPLNAPAPTPTPVPVPPTPNADVDDLALAQVARPWSNQVHWFRNNKRMALALRNWMIAKGIPFK
jgi:hypothetical protein